MIRQNQNFKKQIDKSKSKSEVPSPSQAQLKIPKSQNQGKVSEASEEDLSYLRFPVIMCF